MLGAVDDDRGAEEPREILRDGEPEPDTYLAARTVSDPVERIEDPRPLVQRDPDSGIADREAHAAIVA